MALAFPRISLWLWGGNANGGPKDDPAGSNGPGNPTALSSSFDFGLGFREPETNFQRLSSHRQRPQSSTARKARRKWQSREERRRNHPTIEEDVVVVPSDGVCGLSGSESEDSDWSIGWLEPHAPDFLSDPEDADASFAVIVPCYGRGRGGPSGAPGGFHAGGYDHNHNFFPTIDLNSSETRHYMEDFLSALQANT